MQGSPRESLRSCLEAQRASVSILELLALAAQDGRASFERVKPATPVLRSIRGGPLRASAPALQGGAKAAAKLLLSKSGDLSAASRAAS